MRSNYFGYYHRVAVFSLLLVLSGALALSGVVVADHQDGGSANGTIQGEVTNEIGEPIEDATVNVTEYDDHLETTTDADGAYEIDDVPYDDHDIAVTASDYEKIGRTVTVSTTNSPVTEDFDELERTTGTISGTVESDDGEIDGKLPGVTIDIEHADEDDQQLIEETELASSTETDDNGSYEFEVPTGDVSLTATQDGFEEFSDDSISVSADSTTDVDFDMAENLATVDGTVENSDGDSISNATVAINGNTTIWPGIDSDSLAAQTDSSGEYEIQHVPVSTTGESRTITASANTFDSDEESTEISESGDTVNFELFHEGGSLAGTVEDEHGNQLRGIDVEVDGKSTQTGNESTYEIDELPYGTHEVTFDHPDYAAETVSTEISEDKTTTENPALERTSDVRLEIDSVSPDFWQGGDEVTVTYSFDEEVYDTVDLTVDGESEITSDSLDVGFGGVSEAMTTFEVPDTDEIKNGQYTVELSALGETRTASAEVSSVVDDEGVEFSEERYDTPAGDFVEIDVSTGDLDEVYIMFGGDRNANEKQIQNHLDILRVEGDTTFVINTRLVGTDRPSEDVYIPVSGDVTSYDHEIGADSEPTGTFEDVSFQAENGAERASTLAEFREEMGVSARGSPLQTDRYRLVAGGTGVMIDRNDNIPDVRQPVARSNLVLSQPAVGEVTTYTLPTAAADQTEQFENGEESIGSSEIGTLLDSATETDTVARGDRILIEVQSVGMFGALFDTQATDSPLIADGDGAESVDAEQVQTLLDRHEGVRIELEDSELPHPNSPNARLQFENVDSSDLHILPDDTADQWDDSDAIGDDPLLGGFYIVIDTRGTDPFDSRPSDGTELTFDFAYESPPGERYEYQNYAFSSGAKPDPFDPAVSEVDGLEHFPYFGSSDTTESVNDSFVIEDPYLDYGETTLDDELIVPAESDGVISGETNIAPGSQAEMQLIATNRPDPETITIEDVEISEDRTFEVTEDFSEFEPGERVEVEFYSQGRLIENRLLDKRGVRVVDDLDNPSAFEIENMTEQAEVTRGQRLSAIEATIANTGEIGDRQVVAFDINNETVREQSVTLERGEEATLDLSEQFVALPVGEHSFTVRTEDDERTGQLVVTKPDSESETEINSIDTDSATLNESPEESESEPEEPDEPTESDPEGLVGLFGIRSRDVAVAATVTGAMHILGQWT